MFDWLFGTKRQTSQSGLDDLKKQQSDANLDAAKYYFAQNGNWNSGNAANYNDLSSNASSLGDQEKQYQTAFDQENKDRKYDYFGNGVLGALLNPIGQTVSAGVDLATGNYANDDRDPLSDLGALGESILTFLPGIGLVGKGAKVAKALTSIPGLAATGAGIGAADTVRQEGADTNLGDVASAAGTGALFGGGIPIAGRMAGNFIRGRGASAITKAATNRGLDDEAINQLVSSVPNRALFTSGLKSFIPRTTFGKVAVGGGALAGGNMLLNNLNSANTPTADTMGVGTGTTANQDQLNSLTAQQLQQYLQQMGYNV